jgi:hypothetical protein
MQERIWMHFGRKISLLWLYPCVWLAGCALSSATGFIPAISADTAIPPASPALDQVSAWIPETAAATPTAAQAMVHVALGKARLQAGRQLCGSGLQPAPVMETVGPLRVRQTPAQGGGTFWYYRISQQPGLPGCSSIDRDEQYRAVQANLPAWMKITPAPDTSHAVGLLDASQR